MPKAKRIEDMSDAELSRLSGKAYDEAMPEPDTTFGNLGRKAAGAALSVPAGIAGAALLGSQPDIPVGAAAKYGAKAAYNMVTKDKKGETAAEKELIDAVKRNQSIKRQRDTGENTNAAGDTYKRGGSVSSASRRADGIATKGKTKGTMIAMCGGGMYKGKK
jgi:hypothetical protein